MDNGMNSSKNECQVMYVECVGGCRKRNMPESVDFVISTYLGQVEILQGTFSFWHRLWAEVVHSWKSSEIAEDKRFQLLNHAAPPPPLERKQLPVSQESAAACPTRVAPVTPTL